MGVGASETRVFQSPTATIGVNYVYSMYAKAGEYDEIQFAAIATPTVTARFSLTLGTVISGAGATITSVGDGWYRCALPIVAGATGALAIRWSASSSTVSVGDGTSGIFVWGSQFEAVTYQTLPSTYVQTVASAYYGPRFDYNPVTLAPRGLLIEEQRVNLLLYSEQFDNAGWTKTNSTITANATTAPDGTVTGDKHIPNLAAVLGTSPAQTRVQQSPSATSGTSYTFSIYAKAGEFDRIEFALLGTPTVSAIFSLTLGTVISGTGASITPAGNGWYRCVLTITAGATGALSLRWTAQSSTVLVGDGTSGIFVWGAQLEAGSFATSYIPTVASTVTRAADVATITGTNFSSWYNASEGTVVVSADSSRGGTAGSARNFQFDDGTSANNIRAAGASVLQVVDATVVQASLGPTPLIPFDGTAYKFASAYKLNDFASVTTGAVATDTSGTVPTAINQLALGSGSGTNYLNGHIRTFTFYPSRLTNAQLQALTS
jgi:hypothetical protein